MKIKDYLAYMKKQIDNEKIYIMFKNCFLSTIESSVQQENDKVHIITGDIEAMWLRDSSCQVHHYLPFMKDEETVQKIVRGLIKTQQKYIQIDPYANAFLKDEDVEREYYDTTIMKPYVWERKFELDSLCYPIKLIYEYYQYSGDKSIFDDEFLQMVETIINVLLIEQHHENSSYTFERDMAKVWNLRRSETLQNKGKGFNTNYTGMIWSGFRPSDDACTFNYNIPGNMFCSQVLGYLIEILKKFFSNKTNLINTIDQLKFEIDYGIECFGTTYHPKYGKVYAYETDGFGNHKLMDDANVPSLLSVPYIGYDNLDSDIYNNTRKFILSFDNPYYYRGKKLSGIGSAHTWKHYVWPMSLSIQSLTSEDMNEKKKLLEMIINSDDNTNYCHESVHVDDDSKYTRSWFCWANSLFAEMVDDIYNNSKEKKLPDM